MSSTKLLANLTAGLQHVMQAAVHNRRGVKSSGRLHQIPQLPAAACGRYWSQESCVQNEYSGT